MKNNLKKISKIISSSFSEINENLKKYREEIIVVKYGGSAMLNPRLSETFYKDIEIIVNAGIKNKNTQGAIKKSPSRPAYPESNKLNDPGKIQRNNPLRIKNTKITM